MVIYLAQHGQALDKTIDPDRPLSETGWSDIQRMAEFIAGHLHVDRIVHSGKTRARQTAELLSSGIGGVRPEAISGIAPNDPVEDFLQEVSDLDDSLLVVGHLPFLARLATLLTGGDTDKPVVKYQPGSIVCLIQGEGRREIGWMVTPELLMDKQTD